MADRRHLTFLFTDIEGSTPLWENARAAMEQAVARHEELLGEAIDTHQGRVVKTLGDGLYAVFRQPGDAVMAAAEAMQRLLQEPWPSATPIRVRMGLHTGEAQERRGDYFGPSVNRAARLMGVAHGSQIVLSSATVEALGGKPPFDSSLQDLGEVRLRGLTNPEHAYQLLAEYLPATFPPLVGTDIPTNLPAAPTSFVGRDDDLTALEGQLSHNALVTLIAFGGVGKTRLAIELAARCMAWYPDGVWFVDLATLQDPDLVPQATGTAIGLSDGSGADLTAAITERLQKARALIVLDNCEHVVASAAALVDRLLRSTRQLRVLATSRAPLAVAGEQLYEVHPLAADPSGPGVELFLHRARAVRTGFAPSPAEMQAIGRIVHHLDGIPLAIELAAARTRVLTPSVIAEHLEDRFSLLTGGPRTAPMRQQTLQALVQWSYDLLQEDEQRLFEGLSVFAGSFSIDAVAALVGLDPTDAFELLTHLIDQSLIRRHPSDDEVRFDMLETLRRFGAQRLTTEGLAAELAERHARHFATRCANADANLRGPDQSLWHQQYAIEEPNLLQALEWLGEHDPDLGLKMASQLARFWYRRATVNTGLSMIQQALTTASPGPTPERARALVWKGFFVNLQGDRPSARATVTEALQMAETVDDPQIKAQALNNLGAFADDDGSLREAVRFWEAAVAELDAAGSQWVTGPLYNLGYALVELGDIEAAGPIIERLMALGTERQDDWTQSIGRLLAAHVSFMTGDLDLADNRASEAADEFQEQGAIFHAGEACLLRASIAEVRGDVATARDELMNAERTLADTTLFDEPEALVLRSRIAFRAGDSHEAKRLLQAAVSASAENPHPGVLVKVFHEAMRLAAADGDHAAAATLLGAADRALQAADMMASVYHHDEVQEVTSAVREHLAEAEAIRLATDGRRLGQAAGLELVETITVPTG